MPLLGRQAIPAHGFSVVLLDTFARRVHGREIELRLGVSLLGGLAPGFNVVFLAISEFPN